jgi:hypothetical protein
VIERTLEDKILSADEEKGRKSGLFLQAPYRLPARLTPLEATATTAATAAIPATATAAAKAAALGARARFVDVDGTAVQLMTVETFNRLVTGFLFHFYEPEAARTTSLTVSHDSC